MSNKTEKIIRYIVASALSFGIVWLYAQVLLNLNIFNPVKHVMKDYSITDFYYQVLNMEAERDTSRLVTIVDMTELTDRGDIAYALSEVLEQQPKVVGVDIKFEGLKPENPIGDSLIMDVAKNNANVVFALQFIDDSYDGTLFTQARRSFFADSLPQLKEAIVNMPFDKYGGSKRYFFLGKNVKGCLMPSMIKRLSDEYAGEEIVPLKDKTMKVNWSPVDFRVIPYDSVSYYGEYLADRIVLFGAIGDDTDMHLTPQGRMPGIKLLGYGVETMVGQKDLKDVPLWVTVLVSFLIVLLIKLFFDRYDNFVKNRKSDMLRIFLNTSLVKGFIKFLWMAVFMYFGFVLFVKYNLCINLAWALSAIAFIAMADDLYNVAHKSLTKSKKKV